MMNFFQTVNLTLQSFLLALALAGCTLIPSPTNLPYVGEPIAKVVGKEGMFRDRKEDYLAAEDLPRIRVPAGYDDYIIDDLLVIPELQNAAARPFPDPPRPNISLATDNREVVIQRMAERAWIVADASPSQIWPRLREYWRGQGIDLVLEDPSNGVMETQWFALENEFINREKFQILVDNGFQPNSAEVRLILTEAPQALPPIETTRFPESSVNLELAYDFLLDISRYLANVADLYQTGSASLLARSLTSEGRAELISTPQGLPILRLEAPYDRSWAAVRRALVRNFIEVVSDDIDNGVMIVSYNPDARPEEENKKPGVLKRFFTLGGRILSDADSYYIIRVELIETEEGVEILGFPERNSPLEGSGDAVRALLNQIRTTIA